MAEFCSQCEPNGYDINLVKIALELQIGHSQNFLCEGCNMRGIYKDERGLIYLATWAMGEIFLTEVNLESLI